MKTHKPREYPRSGASNRKKRKKRTLRKDQTIKHMSDAKQGGKTKDHIFTTGLQTPLAKYIGE